MHCFKEDEVIWYDKKENVYIIAENTWMHIMFLPADGSNNEQCYGSEVPFSPHILYVDSEPLVPRQQTEEKYL